MQSCSDCGIELNEETAYRRDDKRWQSKCRNCFNRYCIDRWKQRKLDAIEYKGGKCEVCGYDKFYGALEFHHVNPKEKEFDWKKLRLRNWESIKFELDKCVCVCANCHREIHNEIQEMVP